MTKQANNTRIHRALAKTAKFAQRNTPELVDLAFALHGTIASAGSENLLIDFAEIMFILVEIAVKESRK
ncbi:MAG: hypothetical protein ABF285_06450 [Pacificibacter sp.]|uniref:hypothetical protein n=1 Tax=Pacificibacter sp. TaxID=1917866 RepID=UPI0032194880